jgi:hypothetical protein
MSIKLLINGIAGAGKTSLLNTMGEDTFVVSRDAKSFGYELPHMLVDTYYNMNVFIYGGTIKDEDGNDVQIEGVRQKIEKYNEAYGDYPTNIVLDSVSQITMDVIDIASQEANVYGSQGAEITKELALLTKFIHEDLELNGMNVILMNHVTEEKEEGKKTGVFVPFGQGKFLAKGAFYATTNEAITIVTDGNNRAVHLRGTDKQARTTDADLPDKMWVENIVDPSKSKRLKEGEKYFSLQDHIDYLVSKQSNVKKWSL